MNLLLMALIGCGGNATEQTVETTEAQTENTTEVVEAVGTPETKEVAQKVEAHNALLWRALPLSGQQA